jgi:hypothetical protein
MSKCLNEFQENLNKELNEINKTIQDMKEEFNKDIEILKKSNSGSEKLNKLKKNSVDNLPNTLN